MPPPGYKPSKASTYHPPKSPVIPGTFGRNAEQLAAFNKRIADFRTARDERIALAAAALLAEQSSLPDIQKNIPAEGTPIPIVYGQAQVGGRVFALDYNASTKTWTVGYLVCLGEIDSYVKTWVDGKDSATISGLSVTEYKGTTTQVRDALLFVAIGAGYTDTLIIDDPAGDVGIAYIVLQYTDSVFKNWPSVICEVKGKKVLNYSTSVTEYSDLPALHLADFLTSASYGVGQSVDSASVIAAQTYNADTTPGEARRQSYIVINQARTVGKWVDTMKAYASCWLVNRGSVAYLIPDKPGSSVKTITASDIIEGSMRITKSDTSNLPTVVRAFYTDTTNNVWREVLCDAAKLAGVDAGTTPRRESQIRLPGVSRHSQAKRECIERLDKLNLSDLAVNFDTFDEGLALEFGDVITVSHPYGLTSKLMRVSATPVQRSPGRWNIQAQEYDAAVYDDSVSAGPTTVDSVLPNGGVPSAPTNLVAAPVTYQTVDDFWQARFKITWTAPADGSQVSHYIVKVSYLGQPIWDTNVDALYTPLETATPALEEGLSYDISVAAVNTIIPGPAIVDAEVLVANNTAPGAPSGLSVSVTDTSIVAKWAAVAGAVQYEARYYLTSGGSWASGHTVMDVVFGLSATAANVTEANYTLGVKSIDSVGNYSPEATQTFSTSSPVPGVTVFYQGETTDGIPISLGVGDLWYDTDDNNHPYRATIIGADAIVVGEWVSVKDTVLYAKVNITFVDVITTVQATDFSAVAQNRYPVDTETNAAGTTAGGLEMTLPGTPWTVGQQVYFFDAEGYFDQNPLVIKRNGAKIMELAEDLTVDVRFFSGGLQYVSASIGWQLI